VLAEHEDVDRVEFASATLLITAVRPYEVPGGRLRSTRRLDGIQCVGLALASANLPVRAIDLDDVNA
jgi:hypothetical protein